MDPKFWKDKRVFVTGHTGFKGAWLTVLLEQLGAEVCGYSLPAPTDPSMFEMLGQKDRIRSIEGDICDLASFKKAARDFKPEIFLHMAAQPIVRRSYREPIETFQVNVMGTVHALEVVRSIPSIQAAVMITTDKCYLNREWYWSYREKSPLGGDDPYSASKACSELVTAAYRKSFFNPEADGALTGIASVRAGNVIGGGDWAEDRLIPDILNCLIEGRPVEIRNPASVRPWQHVLEPLSGYLLLARRLAEEPDKFSTAWNFGPDESSIQPVSWIVKNLYELWGEDLNWERSKGEQPHENKLLKLDSSKARTLLRWNPRLDLQSTLSWIVDWTKSWKAGKDMAEVTRDQVANYLKLRMLPFVLALEPLLAAL